MDMNDNHIRRISAELNLQIRQVQATAALLDEGGTVPFIARYRKEMTDSLDEVAITSIRDRLEQLAELDKRREAIAKSLQERDLLTDDLAVKIASAETLAVLEDLYLPYRPKRRTRATIAREKGLEPLAQSLFTQDDASPANPLDAAAAFVNAEKGVESADDALAGARDIIAEWVSENADARARLRELNRKKGQIVSKVATGKEEEGAKYRDYFDWTEPLAAAPSHRVLAMLRGEKEEILTLHIAPPDENALAALERQFVRRDGSARAAADQVELAVHDSYRRLLAPSLETEIRNEAKDRADEIAIRVFADNLRQLLLASPLGQKRVLALDPGFRTGCKLVCLDAQGKLIHNTVVYPTQSERQATEAEKTIKELCKRFDIEAIAVGNGTGGRETEAFLRRIGLPASISVIMVNESGASIYSASEVARDEFPDHDVTVRSSVSIGRRLMDPLAELVKIDPKSIGVGQYQHDVDQKRLKRGLDDVVMSCVNAVGVEVNTASKQLLTYVAGLGPQLAENIVKHRNENGPFRSRAALKKVPRLGPKAFEQSAGFLRIRDGKNALDASAVHPESYPIVDRIAADLGCSIEDLLRQEELRNRIDLNRYVSDSAGLPTLRDIMAELAKPGRDPREKFEAFQFADGVEKMEDLKPGMRVPGIVTNVAAFGAFVDIGVHQDGLVHVSQLADRYIKDPGEVVKVAQRVMVTVVEVDIPRKRIALSMKQNPSADRRPVAERKPENGPTAPPPPRTDAERKDARRPDPPQNGVPRKAPQRPAPPSPPEPSPRPILQMGPKWAEPKRK